MIEPADLTLTRDSELGVINVQAENDAGAEFLDAYNPIDLVVVDSGRVIVPEAGEFALLTLAAEAGLTFEVSS